MNSGGYSNGELFDAFIEIIDKILQTTGDGLHGKKQKL